MLSRLRILSARSVVAALVWVRDGGGDAERLAGEREDGLVEVLGSADGEVLAFLHGGVPCSRWPRRGAGETPPAPFPVVLVLVRGSPQVRRRLRSSQLLAPQA